MCRRSRILALRAGQQRVTYTTHVDDDRPPIKHHTNSIWICRFHPNRGHLLGRITCGTTMERCGITGDDRKITTVRNRPPIFTKPHLKFSGLVVPGM